MSLFMPLTPEQFHSKPMAISSITSPIGTGTAELVQYDNNMLSTTCPSPSSSTQSGTVSPPPPPRSSTLLCTKTNSVSPPLDVYPNYSSSSSSSSSISGSPSSLPMADKKNNYSGSKMPSLLQPSIMSSTSYFHPYHHHHHSYTHNNNHCIPPSTSTPLSLDERRLRNKTASAKYRAKKNQQHGEMRATISNLTKENELLMRQLEHTQLENNHLKATCDRLRGRIMAQKILKQYLVESEQQQQNCSIGYHASNAFIESRGRLKEADNRKE